MRIRRRLWIWGLCLALLCLGPGGAIWLNQSAAAGAATKKPPLKPINLNTASSAELQLVPGIGPATAEKILQMRKSYGAFKSVDDLLAIKGIGKKRLDKMRKYLTVGKVVNGSPGAARSGAPGKANTGNASPAKNDTAEDGKGPSERPVI